MTFNIKYDIILYKISVIYFELEQRCTVAAYMKRGSAFTMKILDKINSPADLKALPETMLEPLCRELREFLTDNVSKTGGHLASNLGVVELTVALHRVFDFPKDKIVFDVGHQSYVHKILTGRRDSFDTLRQFGGLSGFPKRDESEYDCFNTGHSSTSISAALGLARARDLNNEKYSVAALFGDGALTGGMMYEAMNDAGSRKTPLILILNDNAMSITKNVGAISRHLRNLRISPFYFKSKHAVEELLSKLPVGGKLTANLLKNIKRQIRRLVIPTTLFDDLGFIYMGPINGHDLPSLISCLEYAKEEQKPILLHVRTKKGKGYSPAENDPQKFHGISAFDKETGKTSPSAETYSARFGSALCRIARFNEKVIAVTGAMPHGTGLENFAELYKDRFFDVGIAEQHGVTLSAGLAAGGYIPVIPLYSSFLQRAYDQTLHDVCLQNLHVVFPVDRAGIVGADGETHQGIYDISYLSHMPNMSILSPCNLTELEQMLDYAINVHSGPIAIRYPRGSSQYGGPVPYFSYGRAVVLKSGDDFTVIASGRMVKKAAEVCDALEKIGIHCDLLALPTIKPLDTASIIGSVRKTGHLITIEDNAKIGGVGSMIAALLEESGIRCTMKIFAFPDDIIRQGTTEQLDKKYGLGSEEITEYVKDTAGRSAGKQRND